MFLWIFYYLTMVKNKISNHYFKGSNLHTQQDYCPAEEKEISSLSLPPSLKLLSPLSPSALQSLSKSQFSVSVPTFCSKFSVATTSRCPYTSVYSMGRAEDFSEHLFSNIFSRWKKAFSDFRNQFNPHIR